MAACSPSSMRFGAERTMISQVFGSPLGSGIGRVLLRLGPERRRPKSPGRARRLRVGGAGGPVRLGRRDRRHAAPRDALAALRRPRLAVAAIDAGKPWRAAHLRCDAILIQDLGLGERGFSRQRSLCLAIYRSPCRPSDPRFGSVIMSRQNLAQYGRCPWVMHGCLDGAAGFATDALQLFGPRYRDRGTIACRSARRLAE